MLRSIIYSCSAQAFAPHTHTHNTGHLWVSRVNCKVNAQHSTAKMAPEHYLIISFSYCRRTSTGCCEANFENPENPEPSQINNDRRAFFFCVRFLPLVSWSYIQLHIIYITMYLQWIYSVRRKFVRHDYHRFLAFISIIRENLRPLVVSCFLKSTACSYLHFKIYICPSYAWHDNHAIMTEILIIL